MTSLRSAIKDFCLKRSLSCRHPPVDEPDPATTNRRLLDSVEDMLAIRCRSVDQPHEQPAVERQGLTPRPPPRVLCIDDDPDFIRALQIRLESRGIAVLHAATGLDGFCYAVGEPTDAILLDYQLPNGCGGYILEQLKINPTTKNIPVIVISGSKDQALEYTLVNGGAVRFMHKPLDFEVLMNELRKHLAV
jgi:two-component system, OmpR family, response regulator RpaA